MCLAAKERGRERRRGREKINKEMGEKERKKGQA